jgi:zinc transporter, ZIP family
MLEAAAWGFVAASSLLIGAAVSFSVRFSDRVMGLILAFGSGVLMSAVAYELVADSLGDGERALLYGLGFGLGSITFFAGSVLLARRARGQQARDDRAAALAELRHQPLASHRGRREEGGGAIVLGTILDGIPESIVLGVSLVAGGPVSIPVLVAVFISNVPEALGASTDLRASGTTRGRIMALWLIVATMSAAAAGLGFAVLQNAAPWTVTMVQVFAGGAILAMLAESMIPEAYQKGGRAVGLATAMGFALAAALSALE